LKGNNMPIKAVFNEKHEAALVEYDERPLLPNEVRIQTEYASGKHGTTLFMMDGSQRQGQRWDAETRLFLPSDEPDPDPVPSSLVGTSGVGVIIEVGADVRDWQAGDRIFGFMDVSETNVITVDRPADFIWPGFAEPSPWLIWELGDLDPLLALCFEPAYVAVNSVRESKVRFGDAVAVVGLGAIGLLTVKVAQLSGADVIFAVDPLPKRRQLALDYGAHHVVDPFACDAALEIKELTGGAGVDVAIEISGAGCAALVTAIRAARFGGAVCQAGAISGNGSELWLGREFLINSLKMIVPQGNGAMEYPPSDYPLWDQYRIYDTIVSMMRQKKLTAPGLINPLVSIEDFPETFELIKHDPAEVVKYGVRF
jgi:threonine dehydrogenase-like Zn-dependent dehydrogenase